MTPIERLRALARETLRQYGTETAAGGEPHYPAWVDDVTAVCDELERLRALGGGQVVPHPYTEEMLVAAMEASLVGRPSVDDDSYVRSILDAARAAAPTSPAAPQKAEPIFTDCNAGPLAWDEPQKAEPSDEIRAFLAGLLVYLPPDGQVVAPTALHGVAIRAMALLARYGQPAAPVAAQAPTLHNIDAGTEVMAWLRENGAPYAIYAKMSACLFGDPDKKGAKAAQAPAAAGDALDAVGRECLAVGRALYRAAGELPADGEIQLRIENGAGSVYWLDHARGAWRLIDSGETFSEQINSAIDGSMQRTTAREGE